MYIDIETINSAARTIGSLGVIAGVFVGVYKFIQSNKRQSEELRAIRKENALLCYGVKACLEGLIEKGCDGPCKDALKKLNTHLNKAAHDQEDSHGRS